MRYGLNGKVWMSTQCRFRPPAKREQLEKLFNERRGSVIAVPSLQEDNDFEYRFIGCESYGEFELAVFYVFWIDHKKSGLMSRCARDYIPCYRHNEYGYIKNYFRRRRLSRELREGQKS